MGAGTKPKDMKQVEKMEGRRKGERQERVDSHSNCAKCEFQSTIQSKKAKPKQGMQQNPQSEDGFTQVR